MEFREISSNLVDFLWNTEYTEQSEVHQSDPRSQEITIIFVVFFRTKTKKSVALHP